MKKRIIIPLVLVCLQAYSQTKVAYLEKNRFDLTSPEFEFPQKDFKIIGFGAYHGSAKTEKTEFALLKSLTKKGTIKYYLPETDFSIGHYFNQFLRTGDTLLLRGLVNTYGSRVPQENSIETYQKWKEIKRLNDQLQEKNKLTIVGIDLLVTYQYTAKHLLEIIDYKQNQNASLQKIVDMVAMDTTDFSPNYKSYSKGILSDFVKEYENDPTELENSINDKFAFDHIIKNLKITFSDTDYSSKREQTIFDNYMRLDSLYDFDSKPQFLRFGFFHLEKDGEADNTSFFTKLIANEVYQRGHVISVIGYLTKSRVLWDVIYDDGGKYKKYTTEGGYGIGDYKKEYFRGIDKLKETKISDITLFRLNKENTPYDDGIPDLMEIVMKNDKSNSEEVKGKSTTRFLDYAVLISNSKASVPIEEME